MHNCQSCSCSGACFRILQIQAHAIRVSLKDIVVLREIYDEPGKIGKCSFSKGVSINLELSTVLHERK